MFLKNIQKKNNIKIFVENMFWDIFRQKNIFAHFLYILKYIHVMYGMVADFA